MGRFLWMAREERLLWNLSRPRQTNKSSPVGCMDRNRVCGTSFPNSTRGSRVRTSIPRNCSGALPDGTRCEYDPILKRTVEVTPSGERFPVTLVDGKLQRDSEKTDRRKGVLRRSPTPSGDTIPISSPKCVLESSKTGGTNEGER